MTVLDWVAIIGALAWTPHLFILIKNWITKPEVRVITQRSVQLGFTTFGSIFNLRIAFAVKNKDVVISDIKVRLKHESGEERLLEWQGITQHLGKMTMPNAEVMPYEKEHSVLAIKLTQKEIEERLVRFQEPSFIESQRKIIQTAVKKMAYLKSEEKFDPNNFLREQEMTELYNFNKHAFNWKQGKYEAVIEVQSPERFTLVDNVREFILLPIDIENLEKNKEQLEVDYKGMMLGYGEDSEGAQWQWLNPALVKT
jgi:hypothetical protein